MDSWPIERQLEAVRLYTSGMTLVQVCEAMGAGSGTVQKYLRAHGVTRRRAARRPWPPDKVRRAVDLYRAGWSQDRIAVELRAGQAHVGKVLRDAGVQTEYFWTDEDKAVLSSMYLSGRNVSQCARSLRTNTSTIRKHLAGLGIPVRPCVLSGSAHGNWKGGRIARSGGYVYLRAKGHPYAAVWGYVAEHRLVMEQHLGRYLLPGEVVHHRNKRKDDNRIENLELFASNGEHLAHELKGQCPKWTPEGRARTLEAHQRWCESRRTAARPTPGARRSPESSGPTET